MQLLKKRDAALRLYNIAKTVLGRQKRMAIHAALEREKLRVLEMQDPTYKAVEVRPHLF